MNFDVRILDLGGSKGDRACPLKKLLLKRLQRHTYISPVSLLLLGGSQGEDMYLALPNF
jgi:hypothetical protein